MTDSKIEELNLKKAVKDFVKNTNPFVDYFRLKSQIAVDLEEIYWYAKGLFPKDITHTLGFRKEDIKTVLNYELKKYKDEIEKDNTFRMSIDDILEDTLEKLEEFKQEILYLAKINFENDDILFRIAQFKQQLKTRVNYLLKP